MKEDYIKKIDESAERREFKFSPQIEVREEGENRVIRGIAAVVNKTTDLGYFQERIQPGAFDDRLGDDIVVLFNHDPNLPLARTTANGDAKASVYITESGDLGYEFIAPRTQLGNDLLENIRSGVISKSSFAFTVEDDYWEFASDSNDLEMDRRTIRKVKRLYDVSPVTYPAYNQTDVGVAQRSLERALMPEKEAAKDAVERDNDLRNLDL